MTRDVHGVEVFGVDVDPELMCGACGKKLSVSEYLACDSICPVCKRNFNPGCAGHYHLYFEV